MVSMKDIARKCGVSVATVSKALNGLPDVSDATRDRIRKAADDMGYLTNAAARALKTKRTYNLGVLFVDERGSGLAHEYFSTMLESLKAEAEWKGYDITFIGNRHTSGHNISYLSHCRYRGVDGIVVCCVNFDDPQILELVNGDIPVVTIDHVFNNRMAVLSDNVAGVDALVRYIHSLGHQRIGFIHGEMTAVTEKRLASFYHTCEELGIQVPDEYVRASRYHDPQQCEEITKELLALPQRPTCIMFPDDFSALGGRNALAELGLRVPEDISITGYDGIHLSRVVKPILTTYHQNAEEMGKLAVNLLIRQIERPKTTIPEQQVVKGALQTGGSVGRISTGTRG